MGYWGAHQTPLQQREDVVPLLASCAALLLGQGERLPPNRCLKAVGEVTQSWWGVGRRHALDVQVPVSGQETVTVTGGGPTL